MTSTQRYAPALLLGVMLVGCGSTAAPNRAGEGVTKTTLEAISYGIPGRSAGDLLIDLSTSIPSTSSGSLELRLGPEPDSGLPDTSADALTAVRSGKVDLAIVGAHTLADAGVPGLRAFQAPGLLTSRAAVAAALADPILERVLEPARDLGVVPVGLSFEDFRYPAAWGDPLLGPDAWAGRTVATKPGKVLDALIEAMGATPDHRNGADLAAAVDSAVVTGGFFSLSGPSSPAEGATLTVNALQTVRVDVVIVNAKVYEGLSDAQREALATAAEQGASARSPLKRAPISDQAAAYCASMEGAVVLADDEQLDATARAATSVYRLLESDPTTAETIARFRSLAASSAPEAAPASCSADRPSPAFPPMQAVGDQSVLDGVWRITVDAAVLEKAQWSPINVTNNRGTWTMTFKDSKYTVIGPKGRPCSGRYMVAADKLEMLETSAGCDGDWRLLFHRDADRLQLRGDHDPVHDVLWSAGLTRIGDAH